MAPRPTGLPAGRVSGVGLGGGAVVAVALTAGLGGLGCQEETVVVGRPPPVQPGAVAPGSAGAVPGGGAPGAPGEGPATDDAGPPAALDLDDDDFVDSDENRDPFRSFAGLFKVRNSVVPQRAVVMPTTGIDEMRLIAIISGVARPQAMLVDPLGVGHVVQRGDYVGRPEVIQTGDVQGLAVPLNWRVDRIRANEVVLIREDQTGRQPLTRVLPLYENDEQPQP
jgi:type IV pilus assembly protein PilP